MEAAIVPQQPDTVVCKADKSLDFRSAEAFRNALDSLMELGTRNFIIDFSATGGLDSAGLGAILTLHRRLRGTGGRVLFAAPSPAVQTVIGITKCDRVFGSYATVNAALAGLNGSSSPAFLAGATSR